MVVVGFEAALALPLASLDPSQREGVYYFPSLREGASACEGEGRGSLKLWA